MKKRDIIYLLRFLGQGIAEIVVFLTFCIGIYFFLCLLAG